MAYVRSRSLNALREARLAAAFDDGSNLLLSEAPSRHAELLFRSHPSIGAAVRREIMQGIGKFHDGAYGGAFDLSQKNLAEDIHRSLVVDREGVFHNARGHFSNISVAVGPVAYDGDLPALCYKVALPKKAAFGDQNAWVTVFYSPEDDLRLSPRCLSPRRLSPRQLSPGCFERELLADPRRVERELLADPRLSPGRFERELLADPRRVERELLADPRLSPGRFERELLADTHRVERELLADPRSSVFARRLLIAEEEALRPVGTRSATTTTENRLGDHLESRSFTDAYGDRVTVQSVIDKYGDEVKTVANLDNYDSRVKTKVDTSSRMEGPLRREVELRHLVNNRSVNDLWMDRFRTRTYQDRLSNDIYGLARPVFRDDALSRRSARVLGF